MKIAYTSDIHLEFFEPSYVNNIERFANTENADVLVLAGDIILTSDLKPKNDSYFKSRSFLYHEFFSFISSQYKDIICIMGNHEFYYADILSSFEKMKNIFSYIPNVHILENEIKEIQGKKFLCGTMWTDFGGNPLNKFYAEKNMNDFRIIFKGGSIFSGDDSVKIHENFIDILKSILNDDIIVVTHHAPTFLTVNDDYVGDILNYAFASPSVENLILESSIKLWIHGHIHNKKVVSVGNCTVACNAHGYENGQSEGFQMEYLEV